jgi:hypothetical protein
MRRAALLAVLVAACGEEVAPPPVTLQMTVPFPAPTINPCDQKSVIASELRVSFHIGGNYSDVLTTSGSDLSAEGGIDDIQPGLVRPVMLIYEQSRDGFVTARQLAYWLTTVDLCLDSVPAAVTVTFPNDGIRGQLFYLQSEVEALPSGDSSPSCDDGLDEAKEWMQDLFFGDTPADAPLRNYDLDFDNDTVSNLDEACDNTLF